MSTVNSTSNAAAAGATALKASNAASGGGSNPTDAIDWNALIEVAVNARLAKADTLDLKTTKNEAKLASYEQMQTLLTDLKNSTQALRAPPGVSNKSIDVFQSRAAYMNANGGVDIASSVSVTAENGADVGNFDLVIKQLARANKIAGTSQPSKSTDLAKAGVIKVGTVGGATADIAITPTMSMAEIAEVINTKTATTGVQASVVQVSPTEFRLVMTAKETGKTITAEAVSGDNVLLDLGVINGGGAFTDIVAPAANAVILVDGIEITRSTNDISDVIPGVTLHLYQVTPGADQPTPLTSIGVEIGTNLAKVKEAIVAFADAYNAYRDFAYAQQQLPSEKNEETTVLFGDMTLRTANTAVGSALSGAINGKALALLGLTMDNQNKLVLDEAELDDALLSDPEAIQNLMTFSMTSSSANVLLLSRGRQAPPDSAINFIVGGDGKLASANIGGDASMFTISGQTITGKAGSAYEGFSMVFTGTVSETVTLDFTAGIAELLFNASDLAANPTDGSIAKVVEGLEEANSDYTAKSDDIRSQAETYRRTLTMLYARYQAAIMAAESSQDYLKNLMDTWNAPS